MNACTEACKILSLANHSRARYKKTHDYVCMPVHVMTGTHEDHELQNMTSAQHILSFSGKIHWVQLEDRFACPWVCIHWWCYDTVKLVWRYSTTKSCSVSLQFAWKLLRHESTKPASQNTCSKLDKANVNLQLLQASLLPRLCSPSMERKKRNSLVWQVAKYSSMSRVT